MKSCSLSILGFLPIKGENIDKAKNDAPYIDEKEVAALLQSKQSKSLSPAVFRYHLIKKAREINKKILLPEGEESANFRGGLNL